MSVDPEQRDRLRRAKLAALARDALGVIAEPTTAGPLTVLVSGDHAVALVEVGGADALAAALVWSHRHGARRLTVLADGGASTLARLAAYFTLDDSSVEVRAVVGTDLVDVEADPLPAASPEPEGVAALTDVLVDAGVDVVVEHGVVRGEVLGLEVARLVEWPTSLGGDGELHLEVGVGRFDRDATAAARPDESPAESLRRAVELVRRHRHTGAGTHPLQVLARERWLRSTVIADPPLVGAASLRAVGMTTEPGGLKDTHPAAALGVDASGAPVLVVCSTGVDLSFVPSAADTRAQLAPEARLVLALAAQDQHPATTTLIGRLRQPAELVTVVPGWG